MFAMHLTTPSSFVRRACAIALQTSRKPGILQLLVLEYAFPLELNKLCKMLSLPVY
uniref:Uncharacterized protein n=1 Tax=Anguilla anguilla TaxID=7936 RepID=A0A0E9V9U6_ANGAN